MRAVVVHEFGPVDSHRIEEIAAPRPQPGEVAIDVHAIGVNFPDTLMVQGLYQKKPDRPFTPGRDAAGIELQHSSLTAPMPNSVLLLKVVVFCCLRVWIS